MPYKRKYKSQRKLRGRGDYSFGSYRYNGDTPFAKAGKIVGNTFGWPKVGEGVGHVVGRLFGSGDYKMGVTPNHNSIWNAAGTPVFGSKNRTNVVTNREYVRDIFSSSTPFAFQVETVVINPGLSASFPWLSTLAQNYEQYRILGIIYEFKSTVGDNSSVQNVGTVIMGTEYNVNAPPYVNKQIMENSEFAQSAKSVESQIHGIECAQKESPMDILYVRSGAITAPDSIKWYDKANFQIATTGFSTASQPIGELWVSYHIEFYKPQIPSNIGGHLQSLKVVRSPCNLGQPFGTTLVSSYGTIGYTINTNTLTLQGMRHGNTYVLQCVWIGTAANIGVITYTLTGAVGKNLLNNSAISAVTEGFNGTAATTSGFTLTFVPTVETVVIAITGGVIPTASNGDIFVTALDSSLI